MLLNSRLTVARVRIHTPRTPQQNVGYFCSVIKKSNNKYSAPCVDIEFYQRSWENGDSQKTKLTLADTKQLVVCN
jgi:hypothetical protein